MSKATATAAERIAPRLTRSVGFDPLTIVSILTTLLPLLASCFNDEEDEEDPQQFLRKNYVPQTGQFKDRLVRRCRKPTRQAARKNGKTKLTNDVVDELSRQALLEAMNGDKKTVAAVLSEAE